MPIVKGRLLRRRKSGVAFVLSGGGPFGAAQVGLLQALLVEGIQPDFVVGCSVGALNAVFIAGDPTPGGARRLEEVWMRMRRDDLFPGGRITSAWHALRRGSHVFENRGIRRIVENEIETERFEELVIPAFVVATDIQTGEERWFSSGGIADPVLASTAMPGVFPPVTIDGVTYIDGGVANNIPVSKAVEQGAGHIYVLNTSGVTHKRGLDRPHDFVMHGLVLARGHRYLGDIESARKEAEVVEFPPVDVGFVAFTNLSHTRELIDAAFEEGLKFLKKGETGKRRETGA